MPPKLPGECMTPGCRNPHPFGRHRCEACHKAKYLCQREDCNRHHYSNGWCHYHYCHENDIVITKDGGLPDIVGAAQKNQELSQAMVDVLAVLCEMVRLDTADAFFAPADDEDTEQVNTIQEDE